MKKWFKLVTSSKENKFLVLVVSSIVSLTILLAMLSPVDALTSEGLSELKESTTTQVEKPREATPKAEGQSEEAPEAENPSEEAPEAENPSEEVPEAEDPSEEVPEAEDPSEEAPEAENPSEATPEAEDSSEATPEAEDPSEATPEAEDPSEATPEAEDPSEAMPEAEDSSEATPEAEDPNQAPQTVDEDVTTTKDTFESLGGTYSFKYLFNHYNVFSFSDIEAKHIVGPIIAKDRAYGATPSPGIGEPTERLYASDLARGFSSYVGKVQALSDKSNAKFNLNYHYDTEAGNTNYPSFYTSQSQNTVILEDTTYKFIEEDYQFTSPNGSGEIPVYQNDNFIDFEAAKINLLKESFEIAEKSTNIVVSPNLGTGKLEIEAGKNYLIKNADRLSVINIIYPDGYHPLDNPYPYNTILTILDETLPVSGSTFEESLGITYPTIGGKQYQFFPYILVNGEMFSATSPANGNPDYGENGSLIWNMPNLKTDGDVNRLTKSAWSDILGHIFAPNVEFWNVLPSGNSSYWRGGNINGCAIVGAWHGGLMESHMFPYVEGETDDVLFNFSAEKEIVGNLEDIDFQFELSLFDKNSKPDGLDYDTVPQIATVTGDGTINFNPLRFTKSGTYTFLIKEKIPEVLEENVIYDLSEYKLTVQVNILATGDEPAIISKITKIKDNFGSALSWEGVDNIIFTNEEGIRLTPVNLNLNGHKELIDEVLTEGQFKFNLELLEANPQDGFLLENASQTVINQSDGSIVFAPITFIKPGNYSFKIKEISGDLEYVIYDLSEYQLDVVVKANGTELVASSTLTKIKDENGADVVQTDPNTNLEFVNRIKVVDLTFTKQDSLTNNPLINSEFKLVEVDATSYEEVEDGLIHTVVSKEDGSLQFTKLPINKTYKLVETKAPNGYETPKGYWIITIDPTTLEINIEAFDGAPQIDEDLVITNNKQPVSFAISKIDVDTKRPLAGAVFDLYLADDDGNIVGQSIKTDITTDETGKVIVENIDLSLDQLYVLVETKAPTDYVKGENIIFYIKGTEDLFPDIVTTKPVENGGTLEVTNQAIGTILPATGGQGTQIFMVIGLLLMSGAVIINCVNKRIYH